MMKKRLTWFVLLSSICLSSYGQYEEFDLSKFYLPDLERRTLETDFNFFGKNNSDNIEYENIDQERQDRSLSGNLSLTYRVYKNTRVYQRNNQFGLQWGSYFSKNEIDQGYTKSNTFYPGLSWIRTNRKYFKPNTFFEVNQNLDMLYSFYKYEVDPESETSTDYDYKEYSLSGQLPLKVGKGRIEPIQDARHAIYLLEELSKINRLREAQSDEEVMAFGQFIAKIKNKRFFDSRIKRMAEIEAVDSFLTANNYTQEKDARFFATLGDYWDYGAGPTRRAGQRISLVFQPGYYLYGYNGNNGYIGDGKINFNALTLDAGIEFAYEKPISLYWQNSINAYLTGGYVLGKKDNQIDDIENDVSIPNMIAGVKQRVGYYPNTRTYASFGIGAQHVLMDVEVEKDENSSGKRNRTSIEADFSIQYYFSPRFRLSASAYLLYYLQDNSELDNYPFNQAVGTTRYLQSFTERNFYNNSGDYKTNEINSHFSVKLLYKIF
jgi:hypothetical protein